MELHQQTFERYHHPHDTGVVDPANERRTRLVVLLTSVTMVIEVAAGLLTGSMALLADGWHMGTHTFALGISLIAYLMARRHADSELFSFGTGKFGVLAGYTSALFLGAAALWMIAESISRFFNPVPIAFDEAIFVTIGGLGVNLASVLILHREDFGGRHSHHGEEEPHQGGHDHNYQAAYLHVLADTLTSFLAITALLSGRFLGWVFMDPIMGIVGGVLIIRWAWGLVHGTAFILLDGGVAAETRRNVRRLVQSDGESRVVDLHVWRVGSSDMAVIVSVVTGAGRSAEEYRNRLLSVHDHLAHISVEVHPCEDAGCACRV